MQRKILSFLAFAGALATTPAAATPITYTISGNFNVVDDGHIVNEGTSLSNVPISFIAYGDTDYAVPYTGGSFTGLVDILKDLKVSFLGKTYDLGTGYYLGATPTGGIGFGDYNAVTTFVGIQPQNLTTQYDPINPFSGNAYFGYGMPFQVGGSTIQLIGSADPFVTFNATLNAVSSVPESTTWAMMILGMGVVGFAMRRRQKLTTQHSYVV